MKNETLCCHLWDFINLTRLNFMVHQVNSVRKVFGVLLAKMIQFGVRTTSAIMRTRAQFENYTVGFCSSKIFVNNSA